MKNTVKTSVGLFLIILYCLYPDIGRSQQKLHFDSRYHHNNFYPPVGAHTKTLPHHHIVSHHRSRLHYHHGAWYRQSGGGFVVIAPPIGVFVPVLPPVYTTVWHLGTPYYYANETYYVWQPERNGYVVIDPPEEIVEKPQPKLAKELFVYPKEGQSKEQQSDDRYHCHSWAVEQSSYNPVTPPEGTSVETHNQLRDNYQRAIKACLEAKGYSVR